MEIFTEDHFHKFAIKAHSPEWFRFRTTGIPDYPGGIGASEMAKLIEDVDTGLPINEYAPSPAEMFEHKIGRETPVEFSNQLTFWGHTDEPIIGEVWQFWDGTPEGYIANHKKWIDSGKLDQYLIRKSLETKYYLVNQKMPWLFSSLDMAIAPGSANMITGEPLLKAAPLEIKTIGEYTGKGYETGMPTQYVIQLHQQMVVTESDYAEIAIKKAGQHFSVRYYERDKELAEIIIEVSKDWWFNRVLPARRFFMEARQAEAKGRVSEAAKLYEAIDNLQPGPNSTEAYRRWKSGKFQRERSYMKGTFKSYTKLRQYELAKKYGKVIKQMQDRRYNELMGLLVDNQVREIVFDDGYLRMGKSNMMTTKIGEEFDEKELKGNVSKLDFNL